MLTKCVFCNQPFAQNRVIERFPTSRRVAFDPAHGRLWAICEACRRWTLAPFETRWEILEELERITRDRARMFVQGENIALLKCDDLQLIRVGAAGLREEAWWRYGLELARRHAHAKRVVNRGRFFDALLWTVVIGIPLWGGAEADARRIDMSRRKHFGENAWEGLARCAGCGWRVEELPFDALNDVVIAGADTLELRIPCPNCLPVRNGFAQVTRAPALQTLRRLLAYRNFAGATEVQVATASRVIESAGSADGLIEQLRRQETRLASLQGSSVLGLEIALSDRIEWALLAREVKELEAEWRYAETIAAIADGELTPLRRRS